MEAVMTRRRVDSEALLNMIHERKVVTKAEMTTWAECSAMSVWRVLSVHGYLTSFNFNARYYTLRDIPRFDSDGLWFYERIGFSVHGSLTATVHALVSDSAAGLTCAQLGQRLGVNVAPTLRRLCEAGGLFRQKHAGVFVYFAAEAARRQTQVDERHRAGVAFAAGLPSFELVVAVLVELVQRVELAPAEVSTRLRRRGLEVTEEQVGQVFRHYDLQPLKRGLSDC
jgi:hypothetical protein